MRILLVRHGETEWNRTHRFQGRSDTPLNEGGKKQVRALASALKDESFTAIYSSPLSRAVETAKLIKEFHPETPFFLEDGFIEMELGEFDGMDAGHWVKQYPDFRKAWADNPSAVKMPGGENLEEVQARAIDALARVTMSHPDDSTLAICSHNFVVLSLLCHTSGISLDKFRELRQETAAYSVIRKQDNRYSTEIMNERSHLEKA